MDNNIPLQLICSPIFISNMALILKARTKNSKLESRRKPRNYEV